MNDFRLIIWWGVLGGVTPNAPKMSPSSPAALVGVRSASGGGVGAAPPGAPTTPLAAPLAAKTRPGLHRAVASVVAKRLSLPPAAAAAAGVGGVGAELTVEVAPSDGSLHQQQLPSGGLLQRVFQPPPTPASAPPAMAVQPPQVPIF